MVLMLPSTKKNWLGHLNTIFAPGDRNLNKLILKSENAQGGRLPRGDVEASN